MGGNSRLDLRDGLQCCGDGLAGLGGKAQRPHDHGDLCSGGAASDGGEGIIGIGGCNTGELTDLGVGEFPAGKTLSDCRQSVERPCYPQPLGCGSVRKTTLPAEPLLRRCAAPRIPDATPVELGEDIQHARHPGCLERSVGDQFGLEVFGGDSGQIHVPIVTEGRDTERSKPPCA